MKKIWLLWIPALFLLDRAAKIWAYNVLSKLPGGAIDVLPGVVRLHYMENTGAAFSIFSGNALLLVGLTGAMMLGILIYLLINKRGSAIVNASLVLVLAGGVGNLYDRAVYGKVIDYVEPLFINFAVFNLADVFVVCGAIVCLAGILLLDAVGKER